MGQRLRSLCDAGASLVERACDAFDAFVRVAQPLYVVTAWTLILWVSYTFFSSVLREVKAASSPLVAAGHALFAAWLLFNLLFNYAKCIATDPGSTRWLSAETLRDAMGWNWRWCRKCNAPKPPLAHHCSVCQRCVLRMVSQLYSRLFCMPCCRLRPDLLPQTPAGSEVPPSKPGSTIQCLLRILPCQRAT